MGNAKWALSRRILQSGIVEFLGNLAMGGNKITGLAPGTDPTDAATVSQIPTVPAVRKGLISLTPGGITRVSFKAPAAPVILGSVVGPFDLSSVGSGGTVPITSNGGSPADLTISFAAGKHESGATPSTNMVGEVDTKFQISVDGDAAQEVTCDWTGCNTGALIAAQMQTAIRALGGNKALVTVAFGTVYTITSPKKGTSSTIRISRAATKDCCDELKLADLGTNTDGTGDCGDSTAVTAAEIAAAINTQFAATPVRGEASAGKVKVTSETVGDAGTLKITTTALATALGVVADTVYGSQGLGYTENMPDAAYQVSLTLVDAADLTGRLLGVQNRTVSGFEIVCNEAAATDSVGILAF